MGDVKRRGFLIALAALPAALLPSRPSKGENPVRGWEYRFDQKRLSAFELPNG